MSRPIITLTTDFGEGSPYVAEMKGAILCTNDEVTIVDITHAVPPQDVPAAAVALAKICSIFPPHTIHVAVVDPGVGSPRDIICVHSNLGVWIAPDNGVLTHVCQHARNLVIRRLTNSRYWRQPVSPTFHGRDIMAPVAAHLTLGVTADEFGEIVSRHESLAIPVPTRSEREVRGTVISIDSFGNVVTNIQLSDLPDVVDRKQLLVGIRDVWITGLVQYYSEAAPGSLAALFGSHDALELAAVNGNAAQRLGVSVGDAVIVSW
jgi:S-adenosylmethionine hydrolase